MTRPGFRPGGSRMLGPTDVKIKGLNQVLKSTDASWDAMWGATYDWDGWLKAGLDAIAGQGANTVKITGLGPSALSGTKFLTSRVDRVRKYLDYAQSLGLLVYWQPDTHSVQSWSSTDMIRACVENGRIVGDYPNVIGMDLSNEYGLFQPVRKSFHEQAFVQTRAVTSLPLTISISTYPTSPFLSTDVVTQIADYADFFDFHPYNMINGVTTTAPSFFRSEVLSRGKPYLLGEVGNAVGRSSFPYGYRDTRLSWGWMERFVTEPDCMGCVGFSLTDYDLLSFGVFPENFNFARPAQMIPYRLWPNVQ